MAVVVLVALEPLRDVPGVGETGLRQRRKRPRVPGDCGFDELGDDLVG